MSSKSKSILFLGKRRKVKHSQCKVAKGVIRSAVIRCGRGAWFEANKNPGERNWLGRYYFRSVDEQFGDHSSHHFHSYGLTLQSMAKNVERAMRKSHKKLGDILGL
jgi:hypothetical protein